MPSLQSVRAQPPPRRFLRAFGVAVAATGAFAVWLGWRLGGERSVLFVSDLGTVLASLTASVACLRAGMRHEAPRRRVWWLLSAACTAWMFGEVIWTAYDFAGTGGPPVPSWADVGYLAFIPLAVGALLCHPGLRGSKTQTARSLLDGLAIAVSLLFLSWTSVLGPLWRNGDSTTLAGVVTLAYPLGDVVICFFVLLALHRMGSADRLELWCLLAGLIALALADSAFAYVVEVKGYATGHVLDVGWFAGFLAIALGALASNARELPPRVEPSWFALPSLLAPLLPMLVALTVAAVSITREARPDKVALAMVAALILLALLRQALLLLDFATIHRGERQGSILDRITRAAIEPAARAEDEAEDEDEDRAEPSRIHSSGKS